MWRSQSPEAGSAPRYTRGQYLGTGATGFVEEVRDREDGNTYVKKLVRINPLASRSSRQAIEETVRREIGILKRLSEHHIVSFRDAYTERGGVCIIMSPVADMDLGAYYRDVEERDFPEYMLERVRMWFCCLSSGLSYLHSQRVRHKDIKPQNILVYADNILFTDFGISRDFAAEGLTSTTEGYTLKTPMYCPPEAYNDGVRRYSADIFSLGCVFAEMCTLLVKRSVGSFYDDRKNNFQGKEDHAFHSNIPRVTMWLGTLAKEGCGQYLNWVIRQMLLADPDSRPDVALVLVWVTGYLNERFPPCHHRSPHPLPLSSAPIHETPRSISSHPSPQQTP